MEQPMLSVFVITYKHAAFIEQTLDSILNQETTFNFEVIVVNDYSPDNTSDIVNSFVSTHLKGDLIRYFEHERNLGMYANFMFALNKCQGKYIAICEGDDYWIDPLKSQKQVDFLHANPNYEVCFTNIRVVDANNNTTKHALITDKRNTEYERKDLPIWAPLLTRVFRNRDFRTLPSAPGLDTVMLLWQSQFGTIKFINEVTGAYRKHAGGIYSAQNQANRKEQILRTHLVSLQIIDASLYSKYFGMLFKKLVDIYYLDDLLFKTNKSKVKKAYLAFKAEMPLLLKIKVNLALFLISSPVLYRLFSKPNNLKIINHIFLY